MYFDASALVKLVVEEDGSDLVSQLWDGCDAALSSRISRPLPGDALACELLFGSRTINLGDIATGRVKNVIDCLYPALGGTAGAPDDHRIRALEVRRNCSEAPLDGVIVRLWN